MPPSKLMNRALLVGINSYPGSPLRGCVNDVTDMADFLVASCGFAKADIRLLVDDRATQSAILDRLGWLLTGAAPGDRIVFHYSGHGAQMPTRNPQGEVDGLDEVICPVDFDWSDGHTIRDKDFNRIFGNIPDGVKFAWISDSCHSGDLTKELPLPDDPKSDKTLLPPADLEWRIQTAREKDITALGLQKVASELNLAYISGCASDETSSDASFNGRANGALTYFLLQTLKSATGLTDPLVKVVAHVNKDLKSSGYDQHPQIEGSPARIKKPFLG